MGPQPLEVYELLVPEGHGGNSSSAATMAAYAEALACYQTGDVRGALARWDAVAAVAPDDGPTRFYRARAAAQLQALPPNTARLPTTATTVYMTHK
jgi:hypothetical protein